MDARRSARNSLVLMKRRRGSKGGPSPGVPPLRAAPPPAARATPRGRRWTKERVVEDADPYGGWKTGRVPHNMPRDHPTPGRGRAERGEAGKNRDGGTSRTPSPTGRVRHHNARSHPTPGGALRWWVCLIRRMFTVSRERMSRETRRGRRPLRPETWVYRAVPATLMAGAGALLAIECSARCGARPGVPPLDPARFFVKKRGKKLLGLGPGGL